MRSKQHKNNSGFTLIEIMVAMLIGLFLLGGVLQLFSGMNASVRLQEQVGYLQENGRMGIELLSKSIRNADYWGCSDGSNIGSVIDTANPAYDPQLHAGPDAANSEGIRGSDNSGLNNSDTITLRGYVSDSSIPVNKDQAQAASINVESVSSLAKGDIILISNCKGGDIFQITNDPQTSGQIITHNTGSTVPGNTATYTTDGTAATGKSVCNNCLHQSYAGGDATLGKIETTTFSIQAGASGEPALFMTNSSDCPAGCELIEGVENMQILYGEDTSVDPAVPNEELSVNSYVTADNVIDMENVITVKISLLLRTAKKVASDSQTLDYIGNSVTYNDDLLRKVYTATMTIRNRM
jgi:type IV pilus assembly protein PilW